METIRIFREAERLTDFLDVRQKGGYPFRFWQCSESALPNINKATYSLHTLLLYARGGAMQQFSLKSNIVRLLVSSAELGEIVAFCRTHFILFPPYWALLLFWRENHFPHFPRIWNWITIIVIHTCTSSDFWDCNDILNHQLFDNKKEIVLWLNLIFISYRRECQ